MDLSKFNLEVLRSIPLVQKVLALATVLAIVGYVFYGWVVVDKKEQLVALVQENQQLDEQIQSLTIKVNHLPELEAAIKQLEIELAKKRDHLPPKEEAVMLLKQVTDLGGRLGLDIKVWKPGNQGLDSSKLFFQMPVKVEVAGGYHTVVLFFDRVSKLPRIIKVSNLNMGSPKFEEGRAIVKTVFDLTAFAAP